MRILNRSSPVDVGLENEGQLQVTYRPKILCWKTHKTDIFPESANTMKDPGISIARLGDGDARKARSQERVLPRRT